MRMAWCVVKPALEAMLMPVFMLMWRGLRAVISDLRKPPFMSRFRAPRAIAQPRRGAGVVERGGLENRCTFTGTVGSNPTLSANKIYYIK